MFFSHNLHETQFYDKNRELFKPREPAHLISNSLRPDLHNNEDEPPAQFYSHPPSPPGYDVPRTRPVSPEYVKSRLIPDSVLSPQFINDVFSPLIKGSDSDLYSSQSSRHEASSSSLTEEAASSDSVSTSDDNNHLLTSYNDENDYNIDEITPLDDIIHL